MTEKYYDWISRKNKETEKLIQSQNITNEGEGFEEKVDILCQDSLSKKRKIKYSRLSSFWDCVCEIDNEGGELVSIICCMIITFPLLGIVGVTVYGILTPHWILFFHELFFIVLVIFSIGIDDDFWIYYMAWILVFILFFTGPIYGLYVLNIAKDVFIETGERELLTRVFLIPFGIRATGLALLFGLFVFPGSD